MRGLYTLRLLKAVQLTNFTVVDGVLDGVDGRVAGLGLDGDDDRGVTVPGQVDGVCRCPL